MGPRSEAQAQRRGPPLHPPEGPGAPQPNIVSASPGSQLHASAKDQLYASALERPKHSSLAADRLFSRWTENFKVELLTAIYDC